MYIQLLSFFRKPVIARAVVLVFVVVAVGTMTRATIGSPGLHSVETVFSEPSRLGLQIVPASCPSSPHYTGECTPGQCPSGQHLSGSVCICDSTGQEPVQGVCFPAAPTAGCVITASPATIAAGDGSMLSWNTSANAIGDPTLSSVGTVARSGSLLVNPSITTAYTLSGTETCSSGFRFGCATGQQPFSCQVTVTLNTGDNAECVSHTIPATMNPGESRAVSMTFRNTGVNRWTSDTYWAYLTSAGQSTHMSPVTAALNSSMFGAITTGQTTVLNFTLTAPTTPGIYSGIYRMYHSGVSLFGQTCGQSSIAVGSVCTPAYFCSGSNLMYRAADCSETLSQACAYGCISSPSAQCAPPPVPTVSITATPSLLRSGNTASIAWSSTNTASCTVSENNPNIADAWTGTSGSRTSSAITSRTTYTLTCTGLDSTVATDTVTVNVLPQWREI